MPYPLRLFAQNRIPIQRQCPPIESRAQCGWTNKDALWYHFRRLVVHRYPVWWKHSNPTGICVVGETETLVSTCMVPFSHFFGSRISNGDLLWCIIWESSFPSSSSLNFIRILTLVHIKWHLLTYRNLFLFFVCVAFQLNIHPFEIEVSFISFLIWYPFFAFQVVPKYNVNKNIHK